MTRVEWLALGGDELVDVGDELLALFAGVAEQGELGHGEVRVGHIHAAEVEG